MRGGGDGRVAQLVAPPPRHEALDVGRGADGGLAVRLAVARRTLAEEVLDGRLDVGRRFGAEGEGLRELGRLGRLGLRRLSAALLGLHALRRLLGGGLGALQRAVVAGFHLVKFAEDGDGLEGAERGRVGFALVVGGRGLLGLPDAVYERGAAQGAHACEDGRAVGAEGCVVAQELGEGGVVLCGRARRSPPSGCRARSRRAARQAR